MKKFFTVILAGIIISSCVFSLVSCVKYHARILNDTEFESNKETVDKNRDIHTRGSYYPNPDYDPDYVPEYDENGKEIGEGNEEYLYCGEEYPKDIVVVIDTEEELEKRFAKFPKVDITKQMVIIYYYTAYSGTYRTKKIKKVELSDGKLTIFWKESSSKYNDSRIPFTSSFVILIDKVEYDTIKIKESF